MKSECRQRDSDQINFGENMLVMDECVLTWGSHLPDLCMTVAR